MIIKIKKGILFVFLVLGLLGAGASGICFAGYAEGEEEEWSPVSAGPVTTWTAPLCGKGKFVAQPFFFYNRTRGTFDTEGHYDSLPAGDKKEQYQEQIFLQYGLTDALEVDAQTVYQQNYVHVAGDSASSSGLGDSYLFLRYCLFEEKPLVPHVTGVFQVKFPTGKYQKADPDKLGADLMGAASGGGSYDYGFGFNITKKWRPFIFHADFIYSIPTEAKVDGVKTLHARYINYDLGLEYFFTNRISGVLELNGFQQGDREERGVRVGNSDVKTLSAALGVGYSWEKAQALLAYQRTLAGTNADANDSAILTCVYSF